MLLRLRVVDGFVAQIIAMTIAFIRNSSLIGEKRVVSLVMGAAYELVHHAITLSTDPNFSQLTSLALRRGTIPILVVS